jgi:hypothetical protein
VPLIVVYAGSNDISGDPAVEALSTTRMRSSVTSSRDGLCSPVEHCGQGVRVKQAEVVHI